MKSKGNGKTQGARNTVLATLSTMLSRARWVSRAGMQYNGKRDVFEVAGYPKAPTFDQYLALYERDGIAARIVDMVAKAAWRTPPEVAEPDKPDGTEFTKAFAALTQRTDLDLWRTFAMADCRAGVGSFGILLIGTRDVADESGFRQPLSRLSGPKDVLYLAPHDQGCVEVERYVKNPSDPRYGLPELYKLTRRGDKNLPGGTLLVHASRVLHVAEDASDGVHGRPRLQRVLNLLFDLLKVSASTGESYFQLTPPMLQAEIDPSAEFTDTQLTELDDKLAEMVHDMRRTVYGQGMKLHRLEATTPNMSQVIDGYFTLIAGAAGIPKRILFGNEAGELASSTDQASFFGTVAEHQRQHAEPNLLRAFIDRLVAAGALPQPGAAGYRVEWPALFKESEDTIASANLKRAQIAQALTPVGGDPRALVEIDEDRNVWPLPQTPEEAKAREFEPEPRMPEPPDVP
jgi:hypothetical protein